MRSSTVGGVELDYGLTSQPRPKLFLEHYVLLPPVSLDGIVSGYVPLNPWQAIEQVCLAQRPSDEHYTNLYNRRIYTYSYCISNRVHHATLNVLKSG